LPINKTLKANSIYIFTITKLTALLVLYRR